MKNDLMHPSEYEAMYRSENSLWWYVGLRDLLNFYLQKFAAKNSKILDAGCGTGKNLETFLNLGYKNIEGVDFSDDAIKFCKKRGLEKFVNKKDLKNLDYKDNTFDLIYMMDVIYIFNDEDRKKVLKEIYRILKKDGIIIVQSAAFEFLRSQHDIVINTKKRFTKSEHHHQFSDLGFEEIKSSYRVFLLFPLILIFKLIKKFISVFKKESKTDQGIFPFGINTIFTKIQLVENKLFKKFNLPFGSSVFYVGRKASLP